MLLLFDVGNTHVTIGGYDGGRRLFTGRVASDRHKTEDEYAMICLLYTSDAADE